ncbi:MAG: alanine--glyoxylate aminotransferase family protein [bacterium]
MKKYIMTPGPVEIPPSVLLSQSYPIIHHRTEEYRILFEEIIEGLKYVYKTKNDIFVFASSGTGAMESAVVNLLSPREKALVIKGGKFGERWADICERYNIEVISLDVEWGKAVSVDEIKNKLNEFPDIKVVFTTLVETSTGVLTDIKSISKMLKNTPYVLVVDAISGLGAEEMDTDGWGVDVVVAGSQKALMLPPGLAFLSINEKAWKLVENSKSPRFYWDLRDYKKAQDKKDNPFTPAISLLFALKESLFLIKKQGLENLIASYAKLSKATRAGIMALGLELFSGFSANALTTVKSPIEASKIIKLLASKYGIIIAGGQGHLKGKIFRISSMGYSDIFTVITIISALEMVLKELGLPVELGKGIQKVEEVLMENN